MKAIFPVYRIRTGKFRMLLIVAMVTVGLAACNRNEPTPDPPPGPPKPQTSMENGPDPGSAMEPTVRPAIFTYPASDIPAWRASSTWRVAT